MSWKEPFGGACSRKIFLGKVLEMHLWRNSFLSKVIRCRSCSFVLLAVGLALSLTLMFVFGSVAINVFTVAGLVQSVIAWPNLSQGSVYVSPESTKKSLVFWYFPGVYKLIIGLK